MPENRTILEYRGKVDYSIIGRLVNELKALKEFRLLKKGVQKRLYSVFVECLENICRYRVDDPDAGQDLDPYIRIDAPDGRFVIRTGNLLETRKIADLTYRLDKVNSQDHDELKRSYQEEITSSTGTEKGAGLGLLTIALHSRSRLHYSFEQVDESQSYYEMDVMLETGDNPVNIAE